MILWNIYVSYDVALEKGGLKTLFFRRQEKCVVEMLSLKEKFEVNWAYIINIIVMRGEGAHSLNLALFLCSPHSQSNFPDLSCLDIVFIIV